MRTLFLLLVACGSPSDSSPAPADTGADTGAPDTGDTDSDTDPDTDTQDTDSDDTQDTEDTEDSGDTQDTEDTGPVDTYAAGDGPYRVTSRTSRVDGQDVVWYEPSGVDTSVAAAPGLVWVHGFLRSPDNYATAARRAATWGFLVAVPELPSQYTGDHAENGAWLAGAMRDALKSELGNGAPIAIVGHSAGGLASVLAASEAEFDALVTLDGTDRDDLGVDAAGAVTEPTLRLVGEPGTCNGDGNGRDWRFGGTSWTVEVTNATHCDFESDTDWLCTDVGCGDNDSARQDLVTAYAIAWALNHVGRGGDAYQPDGSVTASDRAAGRISD